MEKTKYNRLQELDQSKFEIVKGEPDIRGWDVRYMTGQKLGAVDELIIDIPEKKVRYMVVDLDENELKLVHRKILIPIGLAELDKKEDDVVIPNITVEQLSRLPEYEKNNLNPVVERRISSTLGRELHEAELAEAATTNVRNEATERKLTKEDKKIKKENEEHDPDFYSHEHYSLDNLYKNRLHEAKHPQNESEYYRGLRLWEKRSEGGIVEGSDAPGNETYNDLEEKARQEKRRIRREDYRQRRSNESI
jgi:sporulation protein YlmC with PRC-barrel domain